MDSTSIFRSFDQCRTNELTVTRVGLWYPRYILGDGLFHYGKLEIRGAVGRNMVIETADGKWLIKQLSLFDRETIIFNMEDNEIVGKVLRQRWSNKVDLEMVNGFTASFKKQNIFSSTYNWWDNNFNAFINITSIFKYSVPFRIAVEPNITRKKVNVPFIILLGLQIILLKYSQAAPH